MKKFYEIAVLILIILGLLGILWLLVEPIIWWTPKSELRIYIRLFLVLFAISTFAILRLYNSIVQNTRFSIKLREVMTRLHQEFPALERVMKNLNSSLGNVKASSDGLKKSITENTDSVEKLVDRINRSK